MRIAVVQKCPSRVNYEKQLKLTDLDVFNLSSQKVSRLLKRDVDLVIGEDFIPENYDYVILVGSEALKMFTKATAVTDYTGRLAPSKPEFENTKFIASISPAVLAFKPESKPVWEKTVADIASLVSGKTEEAMKGDYSGITEVLDATEYLGMVLDNPKFHTIGLDSETSALACRDGYVLGICISHKLGQGVYIDAMAFDELNVSILQKLIDTRAIVLHNAKFDMHFLSYHFGIKFLGRNIHDTMIQHYLLDERQGTHGLKSLTMKYGVLGDYDRELDEFKKEYCRIHKLKSDEFSYDLIPWDIMVDYSARDPDATLALHFKFLPIIENNQKLKELYYDLMMPGLHFLTKMEDRGIPISKARLEVAKVKLSEELEALKRKIYDYDVVAWLEQQQGSIFNPNSVQQLRKLLFDGLNLTPTGKLTATGAISTDAEVLKELADQHELPGLILDIRQKTKLISTYIDKLLPVIDMDQRVRTGFNITSTTSGRLSSSGKFNMQQLPRDNPIIKGCILAPIGYKIVAADLTTAEIYYAAVLSGDKSMQQVFINMRKDPKKYPDFHSNIAHMVFHLKCEPADVKRLFPALRQAAKAISFGILYGSGPKKVAESVNLAFLEEGQEPTCDTAEAKQYITTYFSMFKKLKQWIDSCHRQIKTDGYIYNHFGRKRRLHNVNSTDQGVASGEVRSGFNAIIQSVSSDHLLLGAVDADNEIMEIGLDAEIFALVHDSVVAVVREDLVDQYLEILYRHIQTDRGCSIPGCPVGLELDSEPGGSLDYSCGKLDKMFPEIAMVT
jgi:DNA polymerase I-like protein with 3'-5' exonuclease and polymerase domains